MHFQSSGRLVTTQEKETAAGAVPETKGRLGADPAQRRKFRGLPPPSLGPHFGFYFLTGAVKDENAEKLTKLYL
jgi:hypothetical protein